MGSIGAQTRARHGPCVDPKHTPNGPRMDPYWGIPRSPEGPKKNRCWPTYGPYGSRGGGGTSSECRLGETTLHGKSKGEGHRTIDVKIDLYIRIYIYIFIYIYIYIYILQSS
jgi:hypothetical protein